MRALAGGAVIIWLLVLLAILSLFAAITVALAWIRARRLDRMLAEAHVRALLEDDDGDPDDHAGPELAQP